MNVRAIQLGPTRATRGWLDTVFHDARNRAALPPQSRCCEWVDTLYERLLNARILMLLPVVGAEAAGLYWGAPMDGTAYSVHQFVMPPFRRGFLPVRMAKACAAKAFELLPNVTHLMGFTPVSNRAATVVARRAGFRECGVMPHYYETDDGTEDCTILVMEREYNG